MSRRRQNGRKVSSNKLSRAIGWMRNAVKIESGESNFDRHRANYRPEFLEPRLMMKTFGTINADGSVSTATGLYDYYTSQGTVDEIAYNDVAFEAIGCYVDPTSGQAQLGLTPPDNTTTPPTMAMDLPAASIPEPADGENIYKIYIVKSFADSYISMYQLDNFGTAAQVAAPFDGAIPTIAATNAHSGMPYSTVVPGGTGAVFIGDVDPVSVPTDQPVQDQQLTLQPTLNGVLGLYTEPVDASGNPIPIQPGIEDVPLNVTTDAPNNFGNFLIGGTITGTVSFGGNVNEFYAGSVLTGDIDGDATGNDNNTGLPVGFQNSPTADRTDPNNFTVAGDLREFVTAGPVGTDGSGSALLLNYVTSFDLNVGGKIGEMHIGNVGHGDVGTLAGTVEAGNSPLISGQTPYSTSSTENLLGIFTDQTEVEGLATPNPDVAFASLSALFNMPEVDLRNDTPADAQILGSFPEISSKTGLPIKDADGNNIYEASVNGDLQVGDGDTADYYGMALEAGQTITASVTDTQVAADGTIEPIGDYAEQLNVFDPDGRLVASNSRSLAGALEITPDRPGIYKFEVTVITNGTTVDAYNLTLAGVGNLAIGGIVTATGDYNDLTIDKSIIAGNGDIGAISIGGNYISNDSALFANVDGFDFGGGTVFGSTVPQQSVASILVADGDLRAIVASELGYIPLNGPDDVIGGPMLSVPNGNVGLVQTTGAQPGVNILSAGVLDLETQFDLNYELLTTAIVTRMKTDDAVATAIGGYIQVIDANTKFFGDLAVNKGIGTIRAADMNTNPASYIDVNADNAGYDGIIDLIDVSGFVGNLGDGGPNIVTNTGGNVRYINFTGAISLPNSFGGLSDFPEVSAPGQPLNFTDDSGATYTVTPEGVTTTLDFTNASTGVVTTQSLGPVVSVLTYPILDKTGLVPISIQSVGVIVTGTGVANTATGSTYQGSSGSLLITGTGVRGANSQIDIDSVSFTGIGRPITVVSSQSSAGVTTTPGDQYGNPSIEQAVPAGGEAGVFLGVTTDATDDFLDIDGSATVNVFGVKSIIDDATFKNSAVEIQDLTRGEIVNMTTAYVNSTSQAPGVGTIIVDGNLGFATPHATAAAVNPRAIITNGDEYPFVHQHQGVVIGTGFTLPTNASDGVNTQTTYGDVLSIQVGGAVANVQAGGIIQSLIANYGQSSGNKRATPIQGQVDGITGPILATMLTYVDIGQGLTPTGSGLVGLGGLFATGKIGTITNKGNPQGDIRGNVASAEDDFFLDGTQFFSNSGIDAVTLTNGSIIGSTFKTIADLVGHIPDFIASSDSPGPYAVSTNGADFAPGNAPYVYDIGPISINGGGGVIGAQMASGSFAGFEIVNNGFGILETSILGQSDSGLGALIVSGYGIRDSTIEGFGYIGPIILNGGGGLLPVTHFGTDVRPSDLASEPFDPYFGIEPDLQIDINAVLGTTLASPNIPNVTDTGVLQDDIINALISIGGLIAAKARTSLPLVSEGNLLPEPSVANIPVLGNPFINSLTVGGSIGNIRVALATDGFQINAGSVLGLSFGSSVNRLGVSVAGNLKAMVVKGNLGAYITDPSTGTLVPDSYINAGGPDGTITTLRVQGNLNANVYATGALGTITVTGDMLGGLLAYGLGNIPALAMLHVYGGIRDGSLQLNGDIGSIIVNGTLGTATGALTVEGNAKLISVGANTRQRGSSLMLALHTFGTISTLRVHGTITGKITTGVDITNLIVTGDGTTPNVITGTMTIGGRIGTATISNGNVDADISAEGSINTFKINHGSLLAGGTVQSMLDTVHNFVIAGGAAYGLYGSLLANSGTNVNVNVSGNIGDGTDPAILTAITAGSVKVNGSILAHSTITIASQLNLLQVNGNIATGATISAHPLVKQKIKGINDGSITII